MKCIVNGFAKLYVKIKYKDSLKTSILQPQSILSGLMVTFFIYFE